MGIYNSSGAFRVTENDTTGIGVYAADGSLRITVVDGLSFTGLYAADGSINVVVVTANETPAGLYDPCGALRGVTWTNEYGRPPNGAIYMDGLGGTFDLLTPVLTWDGNTADLSPNYSIDLDPTAAVDDVLTFWTSTTSDFASYIEETYVLVIGDLGGSASFASADLTAGTYYVKVKHTRPSPALASDWSNVETVTIVTRSVLSGFTMNAPGSAARTVLSGYTMTHIEEA